MQESCRGFSQGAVAQAREPSLDHRRALLDLSKEVPSLTLELRYVVDPWVCDTFRGKLSGFSSRYSCH